jgi:hypothetical protein
MSNAIQRAQVSQGSIQRDTGPGYKAGNQKSRYNALRHGIFSDVVVLPTEPLAKYRSLLKGLQESLQPEGKLEEVLVEKLASIAWRQRRVLIAESAEIRNGSEFWEWDKQDRERQEEEARRGRGVDREHLFGTDSGVIGKIQAPEILTGCLELLGDLRQVIESGGFDKDRDTAVLEKIYGPVTDFRKTLLRIYLMWFDTAEVSEEERNRNGYATTQQCKDNVLAEIDNEIARLRSYQQKHALMKSERAKLEVLRRSVPEDRKCDRLLRYETSLERGFDRTLNQLERMQRLRRGLSVAPRIEVDVST